MQHPPLAALAGLAREPHGGTGTDDIGGPDVGVECRAGETAGVFGSVDILHQRPRGSVFAHPIEQSSAQRGEFDRIHPRRRGEPAGKRAAQQDMAPARHQLSVAPGERCADQRGGLFGKRTDRHPAFPRADDPGAFGRTARGGGNVELRLEPQQLVELVGRHVFEFAKGRQIVEIGDGRAWRWRSGDRLDHLARPRDRRWRGT